MHHYKPCRLWALALLTLLIGSSAPTATAQESGNRFEFTPGTATLEVGDTLEVNVRVVDADGNTVPESFLFYHRGAGGIAILTRNSNADGTGSTLVVAHKPGEHNLSTRTTAPRDQRITGQLVISVPFPPLKEIVIADVPSRMFTQTSYKLQATVVDAANLTRDDIDITMQSLTPEILALDGANNLVAHQVGTAKVSITADELSREISFPIVANPARRLVISDSDTNVRTGDVISFKTTAYDENGNATPDVPITFAVTGEPAEDGAPAASQIDNTGRFVAEMPGTYRVLATTGTAVAQTTVVVTPRDVARDVKILGHAPVLDVHTSDLWVWEGVDGRDYAITGTWSANGEAYFWDVTDPTDMQKVGTIKVDARTVNDVKVSEDGTVCIISREGASTRRNGIVILDCTDPANVSILSEYDDELTGGVHNVFIYDNHVYAVNNGRRYDIINIEDPSKPYRVGRFELDSPGHAIHDVWIEDGIAYSSNWRDGLQVVDVGGQGTPSMPPDDEGEIPVVRAGMAGGSPANPVKISSYTYPSGWNHAAFPFRSSDTGKFYVIGGDEAFPYPRTIEGSPERAAGWLHFVDFTDLNNPEEVARYKVPEAGSHNYWVEDDLLYVGYYNGGLRVVDISGDLMGDLYRQGREVAVFLPTHPESVVKNAPMVWGVQPHKGVLFVADHYSGLWAVALE